MKKYLLFIAMIYGNFAFSQLNEAFNDDDFTSAPTWSGSNSGNDFSIVTKQLRSNPTTASDYFLSTPNTLANNCQWQFWVNLQFNPSNANYVDIYLLSDKEDLQSTSINGYFVRLGNTEDEICLYKRSGATSSSVKLIDGIDKVLDKTNNKVKIRVTRNINNSFTLEYDDTGAGTTYTTAGTSLDATFTTTAYFGIYIKQSSAASVVQKHFFDDIKISSLNTDTSAPKLLSAIAIDSTTINITFNEPIDSISAKSILNYSINQGVGNPNLVKTTSDDSKYILKLATGLTTSSYTLTAENIKDKAGNVIGIGKTATFSYIKPYIAKKGDLVINEIFADPSPQIDLPSVEFIEIYNTTNQTIQLKNWKYSDPTSTSNFPLDSIKSNEYLILCAKADTNEYKSFGKTIGLSPWPSLNNTSDNIKLNNPENKTIDSVAYSDAWYPTAKKQGGWTLERIDYKTACAGLFSWMASTDVAGGTPGKQNSVFYSNYDALAFKVDSMTRLTDSTIIIYLNKPADISTGNDAFSLNPASGSIKSTTFNLNAKQATLLFSNAFSANTLYQLNVSQLKDCAQNLIINTSIQFTTPPLPPPPVLRLDTAKIYITEIFADPSPEIQLPLVEFVEIYNPGKDTINLDGWILSDPTTNASITNRWILPEEYIILCPVADTLQYQSYGKTIGLSQWPSLNNNSDQIFLKSFKSRSVDSVAYSDTWHTSSDKKQGGWSLERVDYKSVCSGSYNWTSSTNNSGGTPGKPNSVQVSNYDQLDFKADSIKQLSDSTINIFFNKHADVSTSANAFNLQPLAGNIKSAVFDTQALKTTITFSNKLTVNTIYELKIAQLSDCAGNTANTTLNFTTPKLPPVRLDTANIYITEILADPSPEIKLPLTEFVEIFNPGKDTINLDDWTLSNSKSKTSFKQISILPNEYLILCPSSDTSLYSSFGKVKGLSPWPALANTSDKITLKSFKNRLVDSVAYSDSWHTTTSKKQGGWSLERVDYKSVCDGLFNWKSSMDASGGTPGRQNSIQVTNYDQMVFKVDSIKQLSDSTVNIYFNKHADISTATNAFNLNPASGSLKSVTFDAQALKTTLLFSNIFSANTQYELTISQLKDCAGNEIISPAVQRFTTPKLPPVRLDTAKLYITEIFADPSPEVKLPLVEFVEIYNHGKDTIDLDGWTLHTSSGKSTLKRAFILPHEYLILCPAADTLQYQTNGSTTGLSPWPTLTNSQGQVYLKSFKGRLVDSISYSDSWHTLSKKQGGWSLERIDYLSACSGVFNWLSSTDITGGTPGKQNAVYLPNYDKIAFKVDSIQQSDSLINVFFNKPADISTTANAFNLTPGAIKSASFNSQFTKATLFCDKFKADTRYQLTVAKLKDCAENEIIPNPTLAFTTPKLPPIRLDTANLYITEIFADPSPEVKLPLVEFVEIFNPGKDTILLDGWTLSTATSKGTLKAGRISPQEYLIISPDTLSYKSYGKTAGISLWPTLPNASGQIILKSFKGRTVDSLSYKDTWYKNDLKRLGGWSLELIDKQSVCNSTQNWIASNDPSGGTPGKQNSVHQLYNSAEPLKVVNASLIDSVTIALTFNRPPDSLSAARTDNYLVNNGLGKPSDLHIKSDALNLVELKFTKPINRGNTYRIEVINITDCTGKSIQPSNNFTELFYPEKTTKNDVLITEILFNPRADGADFVEIYNNSNHELDLKELSIASIKSPDSIVNRKTIAINTLLFKPKQYLVLSTDPDNVKKEYHTESPEAFLKMPSMPAFNNDAGSVVLLSNNNRIDQFDYQEKMHFVLIKDPKGISLERSNFNRPTNDPGNFRSAAASVGYATPGYKNSQAVDENVQEQSEIALLSKTFSPDNDGFEDALQINYNFKDAGMVANATIYNDKGILIKRLTQNTTLAANGTLVWDGMNDNEQMSPVGVYIVYFEAFNLSGELKKYRKAFVLAAKFN